MMRTDPQENMAAGDNLAAILAIPPFLQRKQTTMSNTEAETNESTLPQMAPLPEEEIPTLEQLLETIRKLGTKIDELTETKRILKKQADAMFRKL